MNEQGNEDEKINKKKIVVIGDSNVGKTSIILRYTRGFYEENYCTTIGTGFFLKMLPEYGENKGFKIWDTAGQERYRSVVPMYCRESNAIIIVFDVTSSKADECIEIWIKFARDNVDGNIPIYIVGNKCDLICENDGTILKLNKLMEKYDYPLSIIHYPLFYVSAKSDTGIDQLFHQIAEQLFDHCNEFESIPQIIENMDFNETREKCC